MSDGMTNAHETLQVIGEGDLSVLRTLRRMQEGSFEESGLDQETFMLVRIAALTATEASPASWVANLKVAGEVADIDAGHVVGTLAAIAPVIGTAHVVSAASNIARALVLSKARERLR